MYHHTSASVGPETKVSTRTFPLPNRARAIYIGPDNDIILYFPSDATLALETVNLLRAALQEIETYARLELVHDRARRDADDDLRQAVSA